MLALILIIGACSTSTDDTTAPGGATATDEVTDLSDSLELAALNVLHGLFCPDETDWCDAPARIEVLWSEIAEAGCPPIVGFAEIGARQVELIEAGLADLCDGAYDVYYDADAEGQQVNGQMVLASLPVVDYATVDLAGVVWGGQWVQVDSPIGPVDVIMTHLASSAYNPPCDEDLCPEFCEMGVELGRCHPLELVAFLEARGAPDATQVIAGDINAPPGTPRVRSFLDAGFADAWELAGNEECDPVTGVGCTCCINSAEEDWDGGGLRDRSLGRSSRIDYVLVRSSPTCALEVTTAPFANEPTNRPVRGVLWPSDHSGVLATLRCT